MQLATVPFQKNLTIIVLGGFLVLAALLPPGDSQALGIGESGNYSMSGSGCGSSSHVDPVTVVFEGSYANAAGSAEAVSAHAGWVSNAAGSSSQSLWVHQGSGNYSCRITDKQRADGGNSSDRFHIRLWFVDASQGKSVLKTVGTPHHEDYVLGPSCFGSHAVDKNGSNGSGFDKGRARLGSTFLSAGHGVQNEGWGNTANFEQCDGDLAGSNGTGNRIQINHSH